MSTRTDNSPLALAKDRVTIFELGARFFPSWRPGKSCASPFREDRKPSFSIFADGREWNDFATGQHGDTVDFLAKARGIALPDACRELIDLAGSGASTIPHAPIAPPRPAESPVRPVCAETPASAGLWREMQTRIRRGSIAELETLARLRGLPVYAGLQLASNAGQLWFVEALDGRERVTAWLLTDKSRRVAQLRRLDGKPWQGIGAKAKTLVAASGDAAWPVGAADIGDRPRVLVAEGSADFLCLWHLIATAGATDCAPVGMLGAGQSIHPEAASLFRGKDVTIYPHADAAGERGRDTWARQLYAAGAKAVRSFNLAARLHGRGKDLNDAITQAPDGLCPTCWNRRIAAPIGGPTCPCTPYTWPEFTADQLANDFTR